VGIDHEGVDVRTWSLFFALLTVAADVFVVGAALFWLAGRFSSSAAEQGRAVREWLRPAALPFAWVVGVVATAGSLYLSEVAHFIPCKLCWYQRIAMYPLVLILGIAAWHRDASISRYVLPLVSIGAFISVYHYQLERFPQQSSISCSIEAPCTLTWIWQFHYISIPFMALSAFTLIATLLLLSRGGGVPPQMHEDESTIEREKVHP